MTHFGIKNSFVIHYSRLGPASGDQNRFYSA